MKTSNNLQYVLIFIFFIPLVFVLLHGRGMRNEMSNANFLSDRSERIVVKDYKKRFKVEEYASKLEFLEKGGISLEQMKAGIIHSGIRSRCGELMYKNAQGLRFPLFSQNEKEKIETYGGIQTGI